MIKAIVIKAIAYTISYYVLLYLQVKIQKLLLQYSVVRREREIKAILF